MHALAPLVLAMLPFLGSPSVGPDPYETQPQAQARPPLAPSSSSDHPINLQLMTVVDHPAVLAGQSVRLPPSRVSRILSPRLVEVRDAREHGPYHFRHSGKYDRLLALLPAGASVSRGDFILLVGTVRTVRGANLTGGLAGVSGDVLEDRRNHALLVATSASTVDGASLLR